jgi:hypothetical protein
MMPVDLAPPLTSFSLPAPAENGDYSLILAGADLRCGWWTRMRTSCPLAELAVQGAMVPAGAANFEDLIALLATDIPAMNLQAGGELEVNLTWQALAAVPRDYTLFLHLLDPADRIVGQIDGWPVQGTYPTSQWPAGEFIQDPHRIPIAPDAAPGDYRLEVGWYTLETMDRLDLLGADGKAVDNRLLLEGFLID